jgi:hypothetical protein
MLQQCPKTNIFKEKFSALLAGYSQSITFAPAFEKAR